MTTTTIRDGVVMLLLVLVKKSAAKTHIYYSIHISLLLFSSHEVETNNVREREKSFRSVLCLLRLLVVFFYLFFIMHENNEIFRRSRENEKKCINAKRGRERKFPPFFDAYDEYIIIAQTRAYTKNHLSKKERIIVA